MNSAMSRPRKILVALIKATFLCQCCTSKALGRRSLAEKPKVWGVLQMDWLRSEDLKEEKNVTTPEIYCSSPSAMSLPKGGEAYYWACAQYFRNAPALTLRMIR